ncbi:hypothetical protein ACLOJK_003712 [Asimina triloba]
MQQREDAEKGDIRGPPTSADRANILLIVDWGRYQCWACSINVAHSCLPGRRPAPPRFAVDCHHGGERKISPLIWMGASLPPVDHVIWVVDLGWGWVVVFSAHRAAHRPRRPPTTVDYMEMGFFLPNLLWMMRFAATTTHLRCCRGDRRCRCLPAPLPLVAKEDGGGGGLLSVDLGWRGL